MTTEPCFTDRQLAALDVPLHPDDVSVRQRLSYLEGHHVKDELNLVFGVDGWTYEVKETKWFGPVEVLKNDGTPGHSLGCVAKVELSVYTNDGSVIIGDLGYGDDISYGRNSAVSVAELAGKEAVTDGIKRCAAKLGDRFGLCLYSQAGRDDLAARAGELEELADLQKRAMQEVEAELGRKPTGADEVARTLGLRPRDLRRRPSLQRVLDARERTA